MVFKKYLTLATFILANASIVSSQVTIGNTEKPAQGALLQLKNLPNITDGSANATKGLVIPRVSLTTKKNDLNVTLGTDNPLENDAHVGLLVYSVTKCLDGVLDAEGLYVWDGAEWSSLGGQVSNSNNSKTRQVRSIQTTGHVQGKSGYEYRIANFGDAGWWMVEDLKETEYENSQPQNPINVTRLNSESSKNDPQYRAYYFPTDEDLTDDPLIDRDWFDTYSKDGIGLLYTWGAATNGAATEVFKGTTATPKSSTNKSTVQGLCPDGWVVPSDYDFQLLEMEIINNYQQYSSGTSAPEPWDPEWMTGDQPTGLGYLVKAHAPRGTHGKIMKTACLTPGFYTVPTLGYSITSGYNAMLNGYYEPVGEYVQPGRNEHHWSSSRMDLYQDAANTIFVQHAAYYRYFNSGNTEQGNIYSNDGVGRYPNMLNYLFNVRCKKAGS